MDKISTVAIDSVLKLEESGENEMNLACQGSLSLCNRHCAIHLKLTQCCKPPTLQFKVFSFTSCYGCWKAGK